MNRQASEGPPHSAAPDPQARVLATLLRRERISLLLGTAPADRGWVDSVLPLLGRRAVDRAVITDEAYGALRARTAERRRRPTTAPPGDIEVVVHVDDWEPAPLLQWRAGTEAALERQGVDGRLGSRPLADALPELSRQCGLRFLFLFDHFDACLAAPPQALQTREFGDEWVRAVATTNDCAHFMLGFDADADELLLRFQHRIPGLGAHWLRLDSPGDPAPAPALEAASDGPSRPWLADAEWATRMAGMRDRASQAARPQAAGRASTLCTQEVYASVEALLARMAALDRRSPWPLPSSADDPTAATGESRVAAPEVVIADRPAPLPAAATATEATTGPGRGIGCGVALALLALAGVLALLATAPDVSTPVNAAPAAPVLPEPPRQQGRAGGDSASAQARMAPRIHAADPHEGGA